MPCVSASRMSSGKGSTSRRDALQGEQPDLGPVAVGDRQLVSRRDPHQGVASDPHVVTLVFDGHLLAPLQEGVTAESDDDPHPAPQGSGSCAWHPRPGTR